MRNKNNVNPLLHAILPVIIVIAYILIGFIFDSGWSIGWLLFFLIPIIETLVKAISNHNPSHFAYPVLATGIFLFTGMMWGLWHPMWVVFLTIPAYYAICDAINKSKQQPMQPPYTGTAASQNGNSTQQANPYNPPQDGYYQAPPANVPYPQPKQSASTTVIVTTIISIAAVIIVGIVCAFSWLGGAFDASKTDGADQSTDKNYASSASVSPSEVDSIQIDWINGNIDIEYYDGNEIKFSESGGNAKNKMCYKIDGRTLEIDQFDEKKYRGGTFRNLEKDLKVQLPKGYSMSNLSFEIVSANIDADDIDTASLDIETVSGNAEISFSKQIRDIDVESVSGDVNLSVPDDISGYTVSKDSVSGSFKAEDFGNATDFGDRQTTIDFESVSGNLEITKNGNIQSK